MDKERDLIPATEEEIAEVIREVLNEQEKEWEDMFSDESLEEEYGDFMREFEKAETIEERTAVMDKYGIKY